MQDIAGCRVVVADISEQDRTVEKLTQTFASVTVVDRRLKPSHGYRAVHLIVRDHRRPVEIQVRTYLQHAWAELCEKFADLIDPAIKYGGGPGALRKLLDMAMMQIVEIEKLELQARGAAAVDTNRADQIRAMREDYGRALNAAIEAFTALKPEVPDDFSN